ncbi:CIA30 family protein [Bacteroidota bacterium]
MKFFVSAIFLSTMMNSILIFDFKNNSDLSGWQVVDDVVMGGKSNGKLYLNSEGHGVFEGSVSLENNGGFSSIRYRIKSGQTEGYSKAIIQLKGDGKEYQFWVKLNQSDYYSYIINFNTTGDWQTLEIPLIEMYPSFRGRKLDLPNYAGETLREIAFLIGNKKQVTFKSMIDKIEPE